MLGIKLAEDLFGGSDGGFDDAREANRRNRELLDSIALPEYEQFIPELANNESALYELNTEDPILRSKQLEALAKFQDLSQTGQSDADAAGFLNARALGDQVARSKTESAIADAQARGVSGGGQEFAMREAASQAAAQRAREAAAQQAEASAKQRQAYLSAYANQLSGARDQDYRAKAANTDVINRFNMANTQARNQTNAANTGMKNEAFMYNQGLKDKNYQNQLGKYDRAAGMNSRDAEIGSAEAEARRRRMQAIAGAGGAIIGGAMGGGAGASAGSQIGSALY